jgi:hypothetical protein
MRIKIDPVYRPVVTGYARSLVVSDRSAAHLLCGELYRLDDVLIAGAAAQVTLEVVPDLGLTRVRNALKQIVGGHDHSRRAETALQAMLFPEPFLDRVQITVLSETFDRRDLGTVSLYGEDGAALHGPAVHEDRAGAALAGIASNVGAGEVEHVANVVDQQHPGVYFTAVLGPVYGYRDLVLHSTSPSRNKY